MATFATRHPDGALFCFRGGLRSEIAQQWLQHGGGFSRIKGGYKAMRRWLIDTSDNLISNGRLLVGGLHWRGKNSPVERGAGKAIPGSIDLEGLANHRGSAFGRRVTEQPTQISFELAFAAQLIKHRCNGHQKLILEDEGRLIGRCALPLALQSARGDADWVQLDAGFEARVQHS